MPDHYCIQCGAKLGQRFISGRERLVCPACGWTMWSRANVGVGGLLVIEGRVLLVERNIEPNAGMWTLVNGYVEADETLDQAVAREFLEETGLQVRPLGLLAIWQTPFNLAQSGEATKAWDRFNNFWCVFGVEMAGPLSDLRPDPVEVRQAHFFSLPELDKLEPVGRWSRWMAHNYQPENGALFHQEFDPDFRATLRNPLIALFA